MCAQAVLGNIAEEAKNASSVAGVRLENILCDYRREDAVVVRAYLRANRDLIPFLGSVVDRLEESPSVKSFKLEFYKDIEEGWENLFVIVDSNIEDMDKLDHFEKDLFGSLFEPEAELNSGRVVLSVG